MTDEEKNQLSVFEARLRHLMFLHDELKMKNQSLTEALEKKEEAMQQLQHDYNELEATYTNLKQARIISLYDKDVNDTKQRLSKLVREIDKCLDLLKG
jgi:chromosome segregation ATPase